MADKTSIESCLPEGWTHEYSRSYGLIINAVVDGRHLGSVTVSEDARGFDLGISIVRKRGQYAGRGWKVSLYKDAVRALQAALTLEPSGNAS